MGETNNQPSQMSSRFVTWLGRLIVRIRPSIEKRPPESAEPGSDPALVDVAVVGAGICGVIFARYATTAGLDTRVVEKQDDVGGLWNRLPAWQDIQNRVEDFAVNGIRLDGVRQPHVQRYVRRWVDRFDLEPYIDLGTEVLSAAWTGDSWHLETSRGALKARHLIAATGVQNDPWVPPVDRIDAEVEEFHSSRLADPEDLAGRIVTVVGGGASSWDLLDLAIEQGASEVHWIHRSLRWFLPTRTRKQEMWPNLRELSLIQSLTGSSSQLSRFLGRLLRQEYETFDLDAIEPDEPFDVRHHMLIPGRFGMTESLGQIERHRGEIRTIEDRRVVLDTGESFETDVVLWGTGFRMDLSYLDLPEYRDIDRLEELFPRLGSLVRSRDYPNLFFVGMTLTDSTSSTPFFAAIESKSIVAHIQGRCVIPRDNVPHQVNHWNLFRLFAGFDDHNYKPPWWRISHFFRAFWYAVRQRKTVRL